ncbi:hypothetical protein QCA50_019234 [Cerrena zonata]|uniref:Uncharacterized protein n=1 Tax=Cerrena zonata TaxID=2478898 RepID=A0AAW0FBD1_9APHY
MPSSEISYDGIVSEAKLLYQRITGTDEDFFDVDFEDEDEENSNTISSTSNGANGASAVRASNPGDTDNEMAIDDSDDDSAASHHHEPFGAAEMELPEALLFFAVIKYSTIDSQ